MKTIRCNVFETNSSSMHSVTIMSAEEWKALENGTMVCDIWYENRKPYAEVVKKALSKFESDGLTEELFNTYFTEWGKYIENSGEYIPEEYEFDMWLNGEDEDDDCEDEDEDDYEDEDEYEDEIDEEDDDDNKCDHTVATEVDADIEEIITGIRPEIVCNTEKLRKNVLKWFYDNKYFSPYMLDSIWDAFPVEYTSKHGDEIVAVAYEGQEQCY